MGSRDLVLPERPRTGRSPGSAAPANRGRGPLVPLVQSTFSLQLLPQDVGAVRRLVGDPVGEARCRRSTRCRVDDRVDADRVADRGIGVRDVETERVAVDRHRTSTGLPAASVGRRG